MAENSAMHPLYSRLSIQLAAASRSIPANVFLVVSFAAGAAGAAVAAGPSTATAVPTPGVAGPIAAAGNSASLATHPLIGVWRAQMAVPRQDKSPDAGKAPRSSPLPRQAPVTCEETLDFRDTAIRLGTSGKEISRLTYSVSPKPSANGFYRLTETVLASNKQPDCAGDVHSPQDDTTVRFVQFSPRLDKLIMCQAESLAACFGPFERQP